MAGTGNKGQKQGYRFGAFKGVFTPSILTILGVIMYLRFGWALGSVGLGATLLIVSLANGITLLTGFSLAALATNRRVEGGGAYHIISRSLGMEAGTAVGVPLFLAQALGIAFYIAGFSESVVSSFPHLLPEAAATLGLSESAVALTGQHAERVVGLGMLLVLTAIAFFSADLALKTQFIVMAAIGLSLAAFFLGGSPRGTPDLAQALPPGSGFWPVFAVIFPAVTGIEAGIAMSGDLKNPAKALPRGTLAAILFGFVVYTAVCLFLWFAVEDRSWLLHPMIAGHVARWKGPVLLGIWAASLSSAMGALLGAPRTLQALARDRLAPRVLGRGYGKGNDPRVATVGAACMAGFGLWMGNLNMIAPVLSMFFLTSYGLLNFSAGVEELVGIPSWRPSFRVPWWLSILAACACFAVMLMLNAGATFIALFVATGLYAVTKRRKLHARWDDVRSAFFSFLVLHGIRTLGRRDAVARTWQPNILVLSGSPATRWYLIELAQAIASERHFITVAGVVPEETSVERSAALAQAVDEYLRKRDVDAFVKMLPAPDTFTGCEWLIKSYGYGPVRPNTILLGETEHPENYASFSRLVSLACREGKNLVIVRETDHTDMPDPRERIDLWWYGNRSNLGLMLALAYLLRRGTAWRKTDLVLKTMVALQNEREDALERLEQFIAKVRLRARAEVLVRDPGTEVFDDIRLHSKGAALVFMGMRAPEKGETPQAYREYYIRLLKHTEGYPPVALVLAAENMDYYAIFDDD